MTPPGDDGVSASQEMQNQVEALRLDGDVQRMRMRAKRLGGSGDEQEVMRATTSDGVDFYTSDKWAEFYPNQEVAVVTSIGQPPIPPEGYVPLRHGHRRDESSMLFEDNVVNGFSVDTLLWSEKLLEERIMQLTAWTRRSPLPRRQKLERINRMVNQCNTSNTKSC